MYLFIIRAVAKVSVKFSLQRPFSFGINGYVLSRGLMTETQIGGLCYVVAAVLFGVWWRLRLEYEFRRDNSDDPENYDE